MATLATASRALGSAGLGALLIVTATASASSADDAIGLSSDGIHWSAALDGPLFEPAIRWVPGDVRTMRFYVRNQADETATMTVDVRQVRRDQLVDTGFLRIGARACDQPYSSVSAGGDHELVDTRGFRPGQVVPVDVRVAMSPSAPNGTMVLGTDLEFSVTLADATAVAGASDDNPTGLDGANEGGATPNGAGGAGGSAPTDVADATSPSDEGTGSSFLPDTGAITPSWLPPFALALIGAGAYLVARRRRDDDVAGWVRRRPINLRSRG